MRPAPGDPHDASDGGRTEAAEPFHLIWLVGQSCDGCTIKALGDTSRGGLEALVSGEMEGLPPVRLHHPIFARDSGKDFLEPLRRAARGELAPYAVVNEASISDPPDGDGGLYAGLGHEAGRPIGFGRWLERLAPGAEFVVAWGDCAVWGGPHSIGSNPSHATGTSMVLGPEYRSRRGLPVVNLPGCAPPPLLLETLARLLLDGEGAPPLELDSHDRPKFAYDRPWRGALATWEE